MEKEFSADPNKKRRERRFNYRLSVFRVLCTEHIYGVWKNRFPALRLGLRMQLKYTCEAIVATAILHNIATLLQCEGIQGSRAAAREGQPRMGRGYDDDDNDDSDDDDDLPLRRQTREEILDEGRLEREAVLECFFPEQ